MNNEYDETLNFGFTKEQIQEAVRNGRLLSMEIEFSLHCNFRCPYCYVARNGHGTTELTKKEIYDVILQGKELGVKRLIILGGEPSIYPNLLEIIQFIRSQNMEVEIFSNGSGITPALAKVLFDENVRVVLKMNTRDEALQDKLAGKPGASQIIHTALDNLKQAGYPSDSAFLAVSTIICRQNLTELPDFWIWLRDQHIEPYFEMITPQENAKCNNWLDVSPTQLHDLFTLLARIDRQRYGRNWVPQPPLVGNKCLRHQFSCLVTSKGDVFPCVGVTVPVGNIREQKLADIIKNSAVLKDLRNYRNTIKGQCQTCENADECYGCRGAAYQLTGDYLASDPMCWKNTTSP